MRSLQNNLHYILPLLSLSARTVKALAFHQALHYDQIYFDTPFNITWVNNNGPVYMYLYPDGGIIKEAIPANANGWAWTPTARSGPKETGLSPDKTYYLHMYDEANLSVDSPEFKIMTLPFSTRTSTSTSISKPGMTIQTVPNSFPTTTFSIFSSRPATATSTATSTGEIKAAQSNLASSSLTPSTSPSPSPAPSPASSPSQKTTIALAATLTSIAVIFLAATAIILFLRRKKQKRNQNQNHNRKQREWMNGTIPRPGSESRNGESSFLFSGDNRNSSLVEKMEVPPPVVVEDTSHLHAFGGKQELCGDPIIIANTEAKNSDNEKKEGRVVVDYAKMSMSGIGIGENGMGWRSGVDTGLGDLGDGGEAERKRVQVLVYTMLHGGTVGGGGGGGRVAELS